MYVVTQHTIHDRWKAVHATQGLKNPPPGITLHLFLTDEEVSKAVCLWEADSVETVRNLVDGALGSASRNEFYAVDEQMARGLQRSTAGVEQISEQHTQQMAPSEPPMAHRPMSRLAIGRAPGRSTRRRRRAAR